MPLTRLAGCIAAIGIAACGGGSSPEPKRPTGPAAERVAAPPKPVVDAAAGSGSAAPAIVADIGCPSPTCAYHAGANAYFTCLSGGAGACFHFGPPCAPADACMYDPADKAYKHCAKIVEGACQQWAAACAPATMCMFDPADGLAHACDEIAGGTCKRYGALCSP